MDELHRDGYEDATEREEPISLEGEETNVSFEADVIDRLAAYGHEPRWSPSRGRSA